MSENQILFDKNKPTLSIDGKVVPPLLYGLSDIPASNSNTLQAQRNIRNFGNVGINLVNVDTGIHLGWHKTTPFEPDAIIMEIASVLEANPNAHILVRLHMNPPYWWLRDNPEECVIYRTNEGDIKGIDNGESDRLIANDASEHMRVSLASQKWIDEACEKLELLCNALIGTPEGEALLGIQVACGIYGEWHQWGTDVSVPMKNRFIEFLKEKYKTEEELKKAWNNQDITFETAEFHPELSQGGDVGFFRNPQKSQHIIDAQQAIQSTPPYAILRFCDVIKKCMPNVIVGTFYGYYLNCGSTATIIGHLEIEKIYKEKNKIDFLCGPFCYLDNRLADGVPMQRGLLESNRLRKLLWLTEMDQHPECVDYMGGDIKYKDSTIATLRRNVLQPLAAGQGLWYYDHRVIPKFVNERPELKKAASIYYKRGWWEEDYLLAEIEKLQQLAEKTKNDKYIPTADVLIVYDTGSYYYHSKIINDEYKLHEVVARCGVSYDCIYSSELEIADIERYKCVIMVNSYMITPENRENIKEKLKNKTVVWLYNQGFCDGKTLSENNISDTVGIKVKPTEKALKFKTKGFLPETEQDIPERCYSPVFAVDDNLSEPIGYYENGEIAAAKKGNNIWFAVPLLTKEIMERIFNNCGVHSYSKIGDPIIAGGGIVAINCVKGGKITITLKNGKLVTEELKPFTTAVYDSETGERLL